MRRGGILTGVTVILHLPSLLGLGVTDVTQPLLSAAVRAWAEITEQIDLQSSSKNCLSDGGVGSISQRKGLKSKQIETTLNKNFGNSTNTNCMQIQYNKVLSVAIMTWWQCVE